MVITTSTIFAADKQYALYKKGQRDLPKKTTFLGRTLKDQDLIDIIMSTKPSQERKKG